VKWGDNGHKLQDLEDQKVGLRSPQSDLKHCHKYDYSGPSD